MNDKFLYNNKVLRERRRDLRNNATEAEQILWQHLKNSKLDGCKFVRQYSIGPYILDFYCPKLRLGIELDGSYHNAQNTVLYDKDRTEYLKTVNIKTIRFWNDAIIKSTNEVLKIIRKHLEGGTPS